MPRVGMPKNRVKVLGWLNDYLKKTTGAILRS
jgi:hypothetical protein